MVRCILFALALSAVAARPIFNMKGQQHMSMLDMLEETTKAQHNLNMAEISKNTDYTEEHFHRTTAMTRPEVDLNRLKPKARKRMQRAQARDTVLYGDTEPFAPPPGHDMFFDFEGFAAYAEAHTKVTRHHLRNSEKHRRHHSSNNATGHEMTHSTFLTACLEINVCASDVATAGASTAAKAGTKAVAKATNTDKYSNQVPTDGPFDVCGQLGFSGTATLETQGGKQKLILSAAVNVAISFKAWGASLSVYAGGQADWNFEIEPSAKPYTSVYDALYGAFTDMVANKGTGKSTVPKTVLERAAASRKDLVEEEKANNKNYTLPQKQKDELTGMVQIHYKILDSYFTGLASAKTAAEAQSRLHLAIFKEIYMPNANEAKAAAAKQTIDQMINKDLFPCAKLIKKAGVDNALFCTILKYGLVLEPNQRKETKGWIWNNEGSSENSKNSIPIFFKEIWPKNDAHLDFLRKQGSQWQEFYKKIGPTDYGKTTEETVIVKDPVTKKQVTFKQTVQIQVLVDATENDPCTSARRMYQVLALNSEAIQSTLDKEFKPSKATFKLGEITLSGFVGATWGSGRMGFCTNDSNSVQFKYTKSFTWQAGDGWDCGDWDGQLWFAFAFNSWFQIQLGIPLNTFKVWKGGAGIKAGGSADNSWFLRYHFSIANGFIKGDKTPTLSTTLVQGVGMAVLSMINTFYQKWNAVKNAEKGELIAKFKDAVWSLMDKKNYKGVKDAAVAAKCVKATDKSDGSTWVDIAKATGKVAVQAATTAILASLGMTFGSLTEIGLQANFWKDAKTGKIMYGPSVDLGTAFFTKVEIGDSFVFYVIQGDSYNLQLDPVTL